MKKIALFLTMSSLISATAFAQVAANQQDVQDVQSLVSSTTVSARYNYCMQGTLTCRQLVLYKDKTTNQAVASFADIFVSAERAVGSTGYFLKNADGTFRAVLDDVNDGQVLPNKKFNENQALTVTFDVQGLPTIHNMSIFRLGTTRYILADMTYTATQASIVGTEYDSADANYRIPTNIVYPKQ
jgi:hypothetical protein